MKFRLLLLPFSFIYAFVLRIRAGLYTVGIFSRYAPKIKSIVVGNLSVGGTGKSPHTLYLAELFGDQFSLGLVSRGYGRKTKGLKQVEITSKAEEVGDEPLMFKQRLKYDAQVVVAERRKEGIQFLEQNTKVDLVVLDDAFQHLKVKAGFYILLTDFSHPFYRDFVLPAGNLREDIRARKRADAIIVTKCPDVITPKERLSIKEYCKFDHDRIFFSNMIYGDLVFFGKKPEKIEEVLLVSGIANPKPLKSQLKRYYQVDTLEFKDHHNYTHEDIAQIHHKFGKFATPKAAIVTTEKDFMRLKSLLSESDLENYPWCYQSISVKIDEEEKFKALINSYVGTI